MLALSVLTILKLVQCQWRWNCPFIHFSRCCRHVVLFPPTRQNINRQAASHVQKQGDTKEWWSKIFSSYGYNRHNRQNLKWIMTHSTWLWERGRCYSENELGFSVVSGCETEVAICVRRTDGFPSYSGPNGTLKTNHLKRHELLGQNGFQPTSPNSIELKKTLSLLQGHS